MRLIIKNNIVSSVLLVILLPTVLCCSIKNKSSRYYINQFKTNNGREIDSIYNNAIETCNKSIFSSFNLYGNLLTMLKPAVLYKGTITSTEFLHSRLKLKNGISHTPKYSSNSDLMFIKSLKSAITRVMTEKDWVVFQNYIAIKKFIINTENWEGNLRKIKALIEDLENRKAELTLAEQAILCDVKLKYNQIYYLNSIRTFSKDSLYKKIVIPSILKNSEYLACIQKDLNQYLIPSESMDTDEWNKLHKKKELFDLYHKNTAKKKLLEKLNTTYDKKHKGNLERSLLKYMIDNRKIDKNLPLYKDGDIEELGKLDTTLLKEYKQEQLIMNVYFRYIRLHDEESRKKLISLANEGVPWAYYQLIQSEGTTDKNKEYIAKLTWLCEQDSNYWDIFNKKDSTFLDKNILDKYHNNNKEQFDIWKNGLDSSNNYISPKSRYYYICDKLEKNKKFFSNILSNQMRLLLDTIPHLSRQDALSLLKQIKLDPKVALTIKSNNTLNVKDIDSIKVSSPDGDPIYKCKPQLNYNDTSVTIDSLLQAGGSYIIECKAKNNRYIFNFCSNENPRIGYLEENDEKKKTSIDLLDSTIFDFNPREISLFKDISKIYISISGKDGSAEGCIKESTVTYSNITNHKGFCFLTNPVNIFDSIFSIGLNETDNHYYCIQLDTINNIKINKTKIQPDLILSNKEENNFYISHGCTLLKTNILDNNNSTCQFQEDYIKINKFNTPIAGIYKNANNLYVCSYVEDAIYIFDNEQLSDTINVHQPIRCTMDSTNILYVVSLDNSIYCIRNGKIIDTLNYDNFNTKKEDFAPFGIASIGERIFVVNQAKNQVLEFTYKYQPKYKLVLNKD